MKFKDVELLPGVVVDVDDPKKIGRVKATIPGVFDSTVMNKEGLPWIYPITMAGYQWFSKLNEGSKIWVFKTENNYKEFWYIPLYELHGDVREIIGAKYDEDSDVLIARNAGSNSIYFYATESEGIKAKVGEDGEINIDKDGQIIIRNSDGYVKIEGGKVYIGKKGAKEKAVLGDTLQKLLDDFCKDINTACVNGSNAFTATLCQGLVQAATSLSTQLHTILCEKTIVS